MLVVCVLDEGGEWVEKGPVGVDAGSQLSIDFLLWKKRKDQKGARVVFCHSARFSDGVVYGEGESNVLKYSFV